MRVTAYQHACWQSAHSVPPNVRLQFE